MATQTFLVGLLGRGIGGSKSRQMHEREAAAQGLTLVYRPIDFDPLGLGANDLPSLLKLVEGIGFNGVNVTHPFKQAIIPYLDEVTPDAKLLGAVNTVKFKDGRRIGHNTDWSGFAASLAAERADVAGKKIGQFGAGGAGSATAFAVLQAGAAEIAIVDPDEAKARELVNRLAAQFTDRRLLVADSAAAVIANAAGVIQTSPIGMAAHPGVPFDPALLDQSQWLADVVYFPRETALVRSALRLGVHAFGGSSMAVYQAAGAFEIFTDTPADAGRMLAAFDHKEDTSHPELPRAS